MSRIDKVAVVHNAGVPMALLALDAKKPFNCVLWKCLFVYYCSRPWGLPWCPSVVQMACWLCPGPPSLPVLLATTLLWFVGRWSLVLRVASLVPWWSALPSWLGSPHVGPVLFLLERFSFKWVLPRASEHPSGLQMSVLAPFFSSHILRLDAHCLRPQLLSIRPDLAAAPPEAPVSPHQPPYSLASVIYSGASPLIASFLVVTVWSYGRKFPTQNSDLTGPNLNINSSGARALLLRLAHFHLSSPQVPLSHWLGFLLQPVLLWEIPILLQSRLDWLLYDQRLGLRAQAQPCSSVMLISCTQEWGTINCIINCLAFLVLGSVDLHSYYLLSPSVGFLVYFHFPSNRGSGSLSTPTSLVTGVVVLCYNYQRWDLVKNSLGGYGCYI